jgi:hypothetical protein
MADPNSAPTRATSSGGISFAFQLPQLDLQLGILQEHMLGTFLIVVDRSSVGRFEEPTQELGEVDPAAAKGRAPLTLGVLEACHRDSSGGRARPQAVVGILQDPLLLALPVIPQKALDDRDQLVTPIGGLGDPTFARQFPQMTFGQAREPGEL